MKTILSQVVHNPISLVILCLVGVFLLFKLIQRLYRYFKRQKQQLERMKNFFKLFFTKNPFKDEFRSFKRQLPWSLRRNIKTNQHYCVFSIAKNDLAAQYSQISHFRKQYYPYYKEKENIRFDLDSQYFIYDLDRTLILEQEKVVDKKLNRLFKKLVNYQRPTIILALDLQELTNFSKEALELLAQSIRRKIRALMEVKKSKLPVFLHIQGFENFSEKEALSDYMQRYGANLYAVLENDEENSITLLIAKIKEHYVEILEKCENGSQATKVLYGLKKLAKYLEELQTLVNLIEYDDAITITPKIKGVFLNIFNNKEKNILSCTYTKSKNPYIKRNIFISIFSMLVIAFLALQMVKAEKIIKQDEKKLTQDLSVAGKSSHLIGNIIDKDNSAYEKTMANTTASHIFPENLLTHQYSELSANEIYNKILYPKLEKSNDATQVLYFLAIMHATKNSKLAKYIESNVALFSLVTGIEPKTIILYLQGNYHWRTVDFMGASITTSIADMPILNYQAVIEELNVVLNNSSITEQDYNKFYLDIDKQFIQQVVSNQLIKTYFPKFNHALGKAEKDFVVKITKSFADTTFYDSKEINRLVAALSPLHLINVGEIHNVTEYGKVLNNALQKNTAAKENVKVLTSDEDKKDKLPSQEQLEKLLMRVEINSANEKFSNVLQQPIDSDEGERKISGSLLYNKDYALKTLTPAINSINGLESSFKKYDIDYFPVKKLINTYLQAYSEAYIAYYQHIIHTYVVPTASLIELQLAFDNLENSNSRFMKLINAINENTNFTKGDLASGELSAISNHFAAWHQLEASVKGKQKNTKNINVIQAYLIIMQQFDEQLTAGGDTKRQNQFLVEQATEILGDTKNSYKNKVKNLLNRIKLSKEMQLPFLYLFDDVAKYGGMAIYSHINLLSAKALSPIFKQVSASYPMTIHPKHPLSVKALTQLLVPVKGKYWQVVNSKLKTYLSYQDGTWKVSKAAYQAVVPSKVLSQINALQVIANKLWTTSGSPKPIVFKVTTLPLYAYKIDQYYLRSASFVSGDKIVTEVNNPDYSESLNYIWWKNDQQSYVSVTLGNGEEHDVNKTGEWSLYKLMAVATQHKNKFTWKFLINRRHVPVSFNISDDF